MALTGLQIFKLLPNTNCKECKYPTCLTFAMKLAAGKEALEKCPYASDELKAVLGAASLPPIRGITVGEGDRAIIVGEETVFFRHEKTFVRPTRLFKLLDPKGLNDDQIKNQINEWSDSSIERAGEIFRIDGIALIEGSLPEDKIGNIATYASEKGMPVAFVFKSADGATKILANTKAKKPLLIPPKSNSFDQYVKMAAELKAPLVVFGKDPDELVILAEKAAKKGAEDLLLAPTTNNLQELHCHLTQLRKGALDRIHPGIAYPIFLHVGVGEFEKGILGISKFASLMVIDDQKGDIWLPLWTLRQNIYTDPQKPLQIDPGIYSIGEPDENSPLLVTTNFSLTYFVVSTELDGSGVPCRLAIVDAEGMSVLTAWSAGKFSGDYVGKTLLGMGIANMVKHKIVIIPGYVAMISGEMEDALGNGWKVIAGPQEASDIGPFFRETWATLANQ